MPHRPPRIHDDWQAGLDPVGQRLGVDPGAAIAAEPDVPFGGGAAGAPAMRRITSIRRRLPHRLPPSSATTAKRRRDGSAAG